MEFSLLLETTLLRRPFRVDDGINSVSWDPEAVSGVEDGLSDVCRRPLAFIPPRFLRSGRG